MSPHEWHQRKGIGQNPPETVRQLVDTYEKCSLEFETLDVLNIKDPNLSIYSPDLTPDTRHRLEIVLFKFAIKCDCQWLDFIFARYKYCKGGQLIQRSLNFPDAIR